MCEASLAEHFANLIDIIETVGFNSPGVDLMIQDFELRLEYADQYMKEHNNG